MGKDTCFQTQQPKFDPLFLQGGRRELILTSCPLNTTLTPWHVLPHAIYIPDPAGSANNLAKRPPLGEVDSSKAMLRRWEK